MEEEFERGGAPQPGREVAKQDSWAIWDQSGPEGEASVARDERRGFPFLGMAPCGVVGTE